MRNRSIVDVPATNYEILIHWANGAWTKSLLRQSLDPILRSDSDDESRTRGVLGPFPFAVQARGRATIYLRMDPWPPPNLEGVQGQPITHDTANNLIRLGGFTATSRELLYLKASIVIGLLTLLAVVSIPLLFPEEGRRPPSHQKGGDGRSSIEGGGWAVACASGNPPLLSP
jgi:hypothetical protein